MKTILLLKRRLFLIALALIFLLVFSEAVNSNALAAGLPERIYGSNRYRTAVEISKVGFVSSGTVILSRGDDFADALAAVPLAYKLDAPILLTSTDTLNSNTRDEINRLGADRVIILGSLQAVSLAVEDTLISLGLTVERIQGNNRFETAAMIAGALAGFEQIEPAGRHATGQIDTAFVIYGLSFPDGLAAASYAAVRGYPILLTRTERIPQSTIDIIEDLNIQNTIVVGGSSVISDAVMDELPGATRVDGQNRYATAVQLAEYFQPQSNHLFITTGTNFPDGITGGVLAAKFNSAVLLVGYNTTDIVREYFKEKSINNITIFGSVAAVSDAVEGQLRFGLPNIPLGLRASVVSNARINLNWNTVHGASAYNVYIKSQGSYVKIATVSQNSYSHTGLTGSTAYWYKVSAVNEAGEGGLSEEVKGVTKPNPGLVTFVLDDGTYNQYAEIYPLFQSKRIPAVWSIPTWHISHPGNFHSTQLATWDQINAVANNSSPKWEINSHSHTHPFLVDFSDWDLNFELSESKKLLSQYGAYSFVYPYYSINGRVVQYTSLHYQAAYAGGLKAGETYPTNMFGAADLNNINYSGYVTANPYALKRITLTNLQGNLISDVTEQRLKALVDSAYANDGWLIFCIHNINSVSKNELVKLIDYCLAKGIPIGVTRDGLDRYR